MSDEWDFASVTTSSANRQSGASRSNDQKGFFGKADRDPLKLFLYGLEPNLEESGVRNLLVTTDCPTPTSVAFKVKTVKEDRGEVQRAYAFVEFATRKEAATAFDELKKRDVKLNYAKLSATPSGIRAAVADFAFEAFRKNSSAEQTVSDLITRFETVRVGSATDSVTPDPVPQSPVSEQPPIHKVSDQMDAKAESSHKYSISEKETELLVGHLVQVLESADSVCKTCASGKSVRHMHFVLQDKELLDPVLDAPPAMQQLSCTMCHSDAKLSKCTGCDAASYCSRTCQLKDWPKHRKLCSLTSTPSASSSVSSRSAGIEYAAQMSPNGSLERISPPLTNGFAKHKPLSGSAGGDNGVAPVRKADPAPKPVSKLADVTDGTTPFRPQTGITRTRIDPDPPSSGRPIVSRADPGPVAKVSPGQLMKDMLTKPLDGSSEPPPKKTAVPSPVPAEPKQTPVSPVVSEPKKETPVRKLSIGKKQNALVVWQDEQNEAIFFLSGDEDTIYVKIDPHIKSSKPVTDFTPQVGGYVLARSSDDGALYRAVVTGIRGHDVAVTFIDYGNSDNVDVAAVRPIPPEIDPLTSEFVPQAVKVTAADSETSVKIQHAFDNGSELFFVPTNDAGDHFVIKA